MRASTEQIIKVLQEAIPQASSEQLSIAAGEIQTLFNRSLFKSVSGSFELDKSLLHPFTCDRSGGESCERNNGTGEGEMSCIDGNFTCPCRKYVQHKCFNRNSDG